MGVVVGLIKGRFAVGVVRTSLEEGFKLESMLSESLR